MQSQDNLSKKAPLPIVALRLADVDTDDGPPPMRNLKPGAKKANAADQFWSDHQEEHEKRAETPTRVDVQEFNKVPRLTEPLNKMAALSKIKSSTLDTVAKQSSEQHEHKNKNNENICRQCTKIRMMEKKRRHKTYRSYSRSKKQELKSRITKSYSRQKNIKGRMSKSVFSVAGSRKKCRCRYCMRVTNRGTCTNIVLKEASTLTGLVFENKDMKQSCADTGGSNTPNGSAKTIYTNSQNSVPSSVHSGSYNSNLSRSMSLDHEPMVTND